MARHIHLAAGAKKVASGESWAEAQPLTRLTEALATAEADDTLLVGFGRDRESPWFWSETEARLTRSGLENRPIRLRFGFIGGTGTVVSATPATGWPHLRRRQEGWPLRTAPDLQGPPFLRLEGSSYVQISGLMAEGAPGTGLISLAGRIDSLTLRDLHLRHAGRGIETEDGAEINRLSLMNCSAQGLGRGFARFHRLSNAVLRDLWLDAGLTDAGANRVVQLISIVAGENLRFENVTLCNAVSTIDAAARGSGYVQGDGVVLEAGTRAARFFNCHARDMGDAGFDLKCDGVEMTDCSARGCKYGVRIWRSNSANRLSRMVIAAPRPRAGNAAACLWLGGTATLTDCRLSAGDECAAIRFGEGPDSPMRRVTLIGGEIDTAGGGGFLAGEPGEAILQDVVLDGRRLSGRAIWDGQVVRFS